MTHKGLEAGRVPDREVVLAEVVELDRNRETAVARNTLIRQLNHPIGTYLWIAIGVRIGLRAGRRIVAVALGRRGGISPM